MTRRKILFTAAVIAVFGLVGIYLAIAQLGRPQNQRTEPAPVGAGSEVTATHFEEPVRSNKPAEDRFQAAIGRANAALDEVEQIRKSDAPNEQITASLERAQSAVLAVTKEIGTAEEQQSAAELAKALTLRLVTTMQNVSEEMEERAQEQARLGAERIRRDADQQNQNPR